MRLGIGIGIGFPTQAAAASAILTPAQIFANIIDYNVGDGAAGGGAAWVGQHAGHSWTAINTPAYSATLVNGHGGFTLVRASSQRFENTTIDLSTPPFTLIMPVFMDAWNSGATLIGASTTTARILQQTGGASPQLQMNNGSGANTNANQAVGAWGVVVARFTNSVADVLRAGGVDVTGGSAGNGNPGATLQIGAVGGAGHCSMRIPEFVIAGSVTAGELTNYAARVLSLYNITF